MHIDCLESFDLAALLGFTLTLWDRPPSRLCQWSW